MYVTNSTNVHTIFILISAPGALQIDRTKNDVLGTKWRQIIYFLCLKAILGSHLATFSQAGRGSSIG